MNCRICTKSFVQWKDGNTRFYCISCKPGSGRKATSVHRCKKCLKQILRCKNGNTRFYCVSCKPGKGKQFSKQKNCKDCSKTFLANHSRVNFCENCSLRNKINRKYNLSVKECQEIFKKQNGICALCTKKANRIDHDHLTKKVRGALCSACNMALGSERFENQIWRQKAISYIAQNEQLSAFTWIA